MTDTTPNPVIRAVTLTPLICSSTTISRKKNRNLMISNTTFEVVVRFPFLSFHFFFTRLITCHRITATTTIARLSQKLDVCRYFPRRLNVSSIFRDLTNDSINV